MFEDKKIRNLLLDEEKVEDLIRKYYSDIYKYCFFHLGNRETAQDITQEVFLKFLNVSGNAGSDADLCKSKFRKAYGVSDHSPGRKKLAECDLQRKTDPAAGGRIFRKRCETTEKLEVESSCDGGLDNVPLQVDIWREIQRLVALLY